MAQLFSSLKNYFVDLFKRIYSRKKYLVKAEGNSPNEHNFRMCPKCSKHIASLYPHWSEQKCSKCGQILHKEGTYEDGKRIFTLQRPLYDKLCGILLIVFFLSILFCILFFSIMPVPDGYVKSGLDTMAWIGIVAVLLASSFVFFMDGNLINSIISRGIPLEFATFIIFIPYVILYGAILILGMYEIKGYSAVPFWTDIPTQQEVYDSQKQEVDQMKPTVDRYYAAKKYSANPQINLTEELLLVAENDFPGLMNKYVVDAKSFKRGSDDEARLYKAYLSYLNFLQAMDMHEFQNQCIADPWNMLTAGVANSYPEIGAVCR
ncbi:MAG: hypothetical protein ACD_7C00039G0002 [uncultured bacterium]|nr:MAG: hypothetical protein ACD_7C00039G0002 [uncultured bacterium]HBR79725.1 hypothetical protein [Candidatus Moranbacteria bacterium]